VPAQGSQAFAPGEERDVVVPGLMQAGGEQAAGNPGAGWLAAIVLFLGLSQAVGSSFNSNFSPPNSDSQNAVTLLTKNFPSASGESDQIVIQAAGGTTVESPAVKAAVIAALAKVAEVPGIESVTSPFSKEGAAQISPDRTVAFANVTWKMKSVDVTSTDAKNLIKAAESADGPDVHISLGGQAISNSETPSISFSIIVGIAAALIILLIVFGGALFSSVMPLLTTIIALVMGIFIVDLLTHAFSVSSESYELAVLIGLGVGIDYGLFIISRHRSGVKAGLSYQDAATQPSTPPAGPSCSPAVPSASPCSVSLPSASASSTACPQPPQSR
jgi:putative drug exporter of the RND superfamily